ncbi:hypothetical protein LCGC14_1923270, partial [marine sediment metagenome]
MGRSSYPGQIDSDLELPRIDNNITEISGDVINSLRDAIFSIEEAIGVNPQGNLADFVARINRVIDHNGNLKTSALTGKGLMTLPIADIHIASNAAIKESKLDLDYATATLNARYVSNLADINTNRSALNALTLRTGEHFGGIGDRHDGYDIDLQNSIRSSDDLETAINILNNDFTNHEGALLTAHTASSISVSGEFDNFSATNVQDALIGLDNFGTGEVKRHQDLLHTNAVGLNKGGEQGEQGNLKETVLASTIFQTDISKATNILQVMRPNTARVTSKDIDLRSLTISASNMFRIYADGVGRSALDVDLTSIIPVDDIDTVVDTINIATRGSNYPVSAYNTGGKLTIAHNILGESFTIQIQNVTNSAATALGFGDVTSTTFIWSEDNHAGYVGGYRIKDLKTLIRVHHTNSSASSVIAPGLGDLSNYDLSIGNEGRVLCNITNHSTTPGDNGTHYIISFPSSESFTLNSTIQSGEFDWYQIFAHRRGDEVAGLEWEGQDKA